MVALTGPFSERSGWLSNPIRLQLTSLLASLDRLAGSSADTVLTCEESDRNGTVVACSRLTGRALLSRCGRVILATDRLAASRC